MSRQAQCQCRWMTRECPVHDNATPPPGEVEKVAPPLVTLPGFVTLPDRILVTAEEGGAASEFYVRAAAMSPAAEVVEAARDMLSAGDYYIAGLQAVQRKQRVTDLDERHVRFDNARKRLLAAIPDTSEGSAE